MLSFASTLEVFSTLPNMGSPGPGPALLGEDGQPEVNSQQDGLPAWSRDAGAFEQYTGLANRDGAGLPGQALLRSPAPSTAGSCASVPRTPAGPPFAIVPFHSASSASMVSGGTRSSPGAGSNGGVMQPAPAPNVSFGVVSAIRTCLLTACS